MIMLAAYTKLKNAQKVKQHLIRKKLLHSNYIPVKEFNFLYFPIIKKAKVPHSTIINTKFSFPQKERKLTIKELLEKKLTKNQLKLVPRAQEVVGNILVLEIPDKLKKKEKIIAEAYLKANKNIETVVSKKDMHSGIFRLRKVKILAGKRTKETLHYENGVKIKLHLEKTYFSARLASERLRIAKLVKKGEEVLVMFSGAAPYPLVIAKNSPVKKIYGVELNPLAHQYALENVKLNRFENKIIIFNGDVRRILPQIKKRFDRVVMPLPKMGEDFLGAALPKVKKNGIIHLYAFLNEQEVAAHLKKVREICRQGKRSIRIIRKVKCGQFSPGTFRYRFDMKVLK